MISQNVIRIILFIATSEWIFVFAKLMRARLDWEAKHPGTVYQRNLPEFLGYLGGFVLNILFYLFYDPQKLPGWITIGWIILALLLPAFVFWRLITK